MKKVEHVNAGWRNTFQPTRPELMPSDPCCYAVLINRRVAYVGQTNNLRVRMSRHAFRFGYAKNLRTPWGDYPDGVEVVIKANFGTRYGDWAMRELRLIRRLNPELNKTYKRAA